jgi:TatD DNase family protein
VSKPTRLELADSHVHLDRYPSGAVPGILERARAAGVGLLLNAALDLETSRRAADLAQLYPDVRAAVGVHPRWLHREDPRQALAEMERELRAGRAVAIGEVGLEYAAGTAPPDVQQAFFAACLGLAQRLDVAVALHVVGADEDALRLLAEAGPVRAVVHYFQGDAALSARYLAAGCSISVGKPVSRPENAALRAAVREVPLDRLLLETDSYPLPGRTTEPRHVADVCQAVAELRGEPVALVASVTTRNTRRLLGSST